MNIFKFIILSALILSLSAAALGQKKAADYKITNVKIVPFDGATGEFQEELKKGDERSFFNDLSISLFVAVEISGERGTFEAGRKAEITVLEGKKLKVKKLEQVGLIGEGGKFFIPVWVDSSMCSEVKITARLIGQKTASTMTRTVPFLCGE